jgi:hypothetical protein
MAKFKDITDCARSKFNFEFIDALVDRVKELAPKTELFILAEGIFWHPEAKSWVFHKNRIAEYDATGDLEISGKESVNGGDTNG